MVSFTLHRRNGVRQRTQVESWGARFRTSRITFQFLFFGMRGVGGTHPSRVYANSVQADVFSSTSFSLKNSPTWRSNTNILQEHLHVSEKPFGTTPASFPTTTAISRTTTAISRCTPT
ncbi:hypothetical protein SETIT_2G273000v2 [Setaria italica]|uniref:Uncharacterized protein n=1 Tax=Setaria italica TaxID=4555 RepID=A0A368Q371_SETIT|nr:hypothetical protein SETIT_2G273000v2 [Setaria italica]